MSRAHLGFRTVVADPAWAFNDRLPGPGRGAAKHYRVLTLAELCVLQLPPVADDAVLALWRVGSMQTEALALARAWGFDPPTSEIVWVKTKDRDRPATSVRMGMGRKTVRNVHEICLLCCRGRSIRRRADEVSTLFSPRAEHSRKPDAFYAKIERLFPGPYLELFARRQRPGWTCIGDEIGSVLT